MYVSFLKRVLINAAYNGMVGGFAAIVAVPDHNVEALAWAFLFGFIGAAVIVLRENEKKFSVGNKGTSKWSSCLLF